MGRVGPGSGFRCTDQFRRQRDGGGNAAFLHGELVYAGVPGPAQRLRLQHHLSGGAVHAGRRPAVRLQHPVGVGYRAARASTGSGCFRTDRDPVRRPPLHTAGCAALHAADGGHDSAGSAPTPPTEREAGRVRGGEG